jgi:hypothetical protein
MRLCAARAATTWPRVTGQPLVGLRLGRERRRVRLPVDHQPCPVAAGRKPVHACPGFGFPLAKHRRASGWRGGEQSTGCSGGSPLAGIVQHLPGGLGCVAQPLAILDGRGPRRGIGDESVETREVFEVTLWSPNMVAGRGRRLDH